MFDCYLDLICIINVIIGNQKKALNPHAKKAGCNECYPRCFITLQHYKSPMRALGQCF